jgi:hypothetical protein
MCQPCTELFSSEELPFAIYRTDAWCGKLRGVLGCIIHERVALAFPWLDGM